MRNCIAAVHHLFQTQSRYKKHLNLATHEYCTVDLNVSVNGLKREKIAYTPNKQTEKSFVSSGS